MFCQIILNDITLEIIHKNIKNIHISVHPPDGAVRISAPIWTTEDQIRTVVISKLEWIKKQRKAMEEQTRETPREFYNQQTHYVWGCPYLLRLENKRWLPSRITLDQSTLILRVSPDANNEDMYKILQCWYREILREAAVPRIEKWSKKLNLPPISFRIRRMKTRWGSCSPTKFKILLNTELAKKPYDCLELVILHELLHFFEANHGKRFYALLDQYMPQWKSIKDLLRKC